MKRAVARLFKTPVTFLTARKPDLKKCIGWNRLLDGLCI